MPTDGGVAPLAPWQQDVVCRRVAVEIERAGQQLGLRLPCIRVNFDLSGTSVGMYCHRGEDRWLRFNPWIFSTDMALHLQDTVIHEVAHYAINIKYGRRRLKPHGVEWQALMVKMGADPRATFQADLTAVPVRRQKRHLYRCDCRDHELSSTRHNRIQRRKAVYRCCYCHGKLALSSH